jgi:hypothetical protein
MAQEREARHLRFASARGKSVCCCHHGRPAASTGRPIWLSPPRLHLWEDPAGEAPLADDNKVNCCSTI